MVRSAAILLACRPQSTIRQPASRSPGTRALVEQQPPDRDEPGARSCASDLGLPRGVLACQSLAFRSSWRRRAGSARMSISVIFPCRTVKPRI